jgi:hypothetical protein
VEQMLPGILNLHQQLGLGSGILLKKAFGIVLERNASSANFDAFYG